MATKCCIHVLDQDLTRILRICKQNVLSFFFDGVVFIHKDYKCEFYYCEFYLSPSVNNVFPNVKGI